MNINPHPFYLNSAIPLKFNTHADLTNALSLTLVVQKPDLSTVLAFTGTLSNFYYVLATIPAVNVDQEGTWSVQAQIVFPDIGLQTSETDQFIVKPVFSVAFAI